MNSSGKVKHANDSTARLISYNVHQLKNDKQNSCLTWMLRTLTWNSLQGYWLILRETAVTSWIGLEILCLSYYEQVPVLHNTTGTVNLVLVVRESNKRVCHSFKRENCTILDQNETEQSVLNMKFLDCLQSVRINFQLCKTFVNI